MKCTIKLLRHLITDRQEHEPTAPPIVCNNGLTLSVQVGKYFYCRPREEKAIYTHAEVGFPSRRIRSLMRYVENIHMPTKTIYSSYVPLEEIVKVINDAGGLAEEYLI